MLSLEVDMLKRVVRKALNARKASQDPLEPQGSRRDPVPSRADTPAPAVTGPAEDSIAARIASGQTKNGTPKVSATSGASAHSQDFSTSEDGVVYWGDTDNESARARGRGETLVIDQWECIACGTCVENTDAVFILPDDAKAVVIRQQGDMTLIQDAIDACPVTCIHWSGEPTEFEQLNDAHGDPI